MNLRRNLEYSELAEKLLSDFKGKISIEDETMERNRFRIFRRGEGHKKIFVREGAWFTEEWVDRCRRLGPTYDEFKIEIETWLAE